MTSNREKLRSGLCGCGVLCMLTWPQILTFSIRSGISIIIYKCFTTQHHVPTTVAGDACRKNSVYSAVCNGVSIPCSPNTSCKRRSHSQSAAVASVLNGCSIVSCVTAPSAMVAEPELDHSSTWHRLYASLKQQNKNSSNSVDNS